MNRRFKMGDTFMSLFPTYRLTRDFKRTTMKKAFQYPKINVDGMPIDYQEKLFNRRMDRIKDYTEEMMKVQSIKRDLKLK